jgi:hypothetical protein
MKSQLKTLGLPSRLFWNLLKFLSTDPTESTVCIVDDVTAMYSTVR